MEAKFVRRLLILWPCVACLWLATLPALFAQEPKPPAKTPDIQGTWNLVCWEKNGKDQERTKARVFITGSQIPGEIRAPEPRGVPGAGPTAESPPFGTHKITLASQEGL
jgi:hypothetical protein